MRPLRIVLKIIESNTVFSTAVEGSNHIMYYFLGSNSYCSSWTMLFEFPKLPDLSPPWTRKFLSFSGYVIQLEYQAAVVFFVALWKCKMNEMSLWLNRPGIVSFGESLPGCSSSSQEIRKAKCQRQREKPDRYSIESTPKCSLDIALGNNSRCDVTYVRTYIHTGILTDNGHRMRTHCMKYTIL